MYKVINVNPNKEERPLLSLVNVQDESDQIFCADDSWTEGDLVEEDGFYTEVCNYVDDQGLGSADFAFPKQNAIV